MDAVVLNSVVVERKEQGSGRARTASIDDVLIRFDLVPGAWRGPVKRAGGLGRRWGWRGEPCSW